MARRSVDSDLLPADADAASEHHSGREAAGGSGALTRLAVHAGVLLVFAIAEAIRESDGANSASLAHPAVVHALLAAGVAVVCALWRWSPWYSLLIFGAIQNIVVIAMPSDENVTEGDGVMTRVLEASVLQFLLVAQGLLDSLASVLLACASFLALLAVEITRGGSANNIFSAAFLLFALGAASTFASTKAVDIPFLPRRRNVSVELALTPILSLGSTSVGAADDEPFEMNTRLDRVISRLSMSREACQTSLAPELGGPMGLMFDVLLHELSADSSLHALPMAELAGASPMVLEYVKKTLKQDVHTAEQHDAPLADEVRLARADVSGERFSVPSTGEPDKDTWETERSSERGGVPGPATIDAAVASMTEVLLYCEKVAEVLAPSISDALQQMLTSSLGSWGIDMFQAAKLADGRLLAAVGLQASKPHAEGLHLDPIALAKCLRALESRYHSRNTYHNSLHAADVTNSMAYFISLNRTAFGSFDHLECFAGILAAAAHDVGHPGVANSFHVATQSALSLLYNDQSMLENMHCAILFAVLQARPSNVLSALEPSMRVAFRKLALHAILETDLAKHVQAVSRFRNEFLGADDKVDANGRRDSTALGPARRRELLVFALKAADVSGSGKAFAFHAQWTLRINSEFFEQGDTERSLGLPCSPFCDRHCTVVADSQVGFFDFIVKPLYTALDDFLCSGRFRLEVLPEIETNRHFWKCYDGAGFIYARPMDNADLLLDAFVNHQRRMRLSAGAIRGDQGGAGKPYASGRRPSVSVAAVAAAAATTVVQPQRRRSVSGWLSPSASNPPPSRASFSTNRSSFSVASGLPSTLGRALSPRQSSVAPCNTTAEG